MRCRDSGDWYTLGPPNAQSKTLQAVPNQPGSLVQSRSTTGIAVDLHLVLRHLSPRRGELGRGRGERYLQAGSGAPSRIALQAYWGREASASAAPATTSTSGTHRFFRANGAVDPAPQYPPLDLDLREQMAPRVVFPTPRPYVAPTFFSSRRRSCRPRVTGNEIVLPFGSGARHMQ
jgi:hypothetical protein